MTEPSSARPLPEPPRPGPAAAGAPAGDPGPAADERFETPSFEDLEHRPVAEHVGVFEAEHARLHRELGTIDQV